MFSVKIWSIVSVNIILICLTTITIAKTNNIIDIPVKKSDIDCCLNRENKTINDKRIENKTTIADGINLITDELTIHSNERLTVERNAHPYVVPRKGVNAKSISARKGVDNITNDQMNLIDDKTLIMKEIAIDKINNTMNLDVQKNITETIVVNNSTIKNVNTLKKKFRPKPTVTVVGIDDDISKPFIHGSPTKSPPLGMSTKINYVVPVVITILILPLFVISMIYIYKNGRDCWEKRHYRRMDFLIDGMYNE